MTREDTKVIQIGTVKIGGGNPVAIQSMTNTKTEDVEATVQQILALEAAGCQIIRCAVPTMEAAEAIREIKKRIHIPLVADIHFDYRLAIAAIENGADKIRINPGNIGDRSRVQAVVDKAKEYNIPIRVGVNSGSLEKPLLEKYGGVIVYLNSFIFFSSFLSFSLYFHPLYLFFGSGFFRITIPAIAITAPTANAIKNIGA